MKFYYVRTPDHPGRPRPQQSKRWLWVPLLAVVLLILCCIGVLLGIW